MSERPELSRALDGADFRGYYYLKEELAAFCRREGLRATGGKLELTERIAHYLDTGEKTESVTKALPKARETGVISPESIIETPFVCSERHRAFFKEQIGKGFSFNVGFQTWLKSNPGRTYAEAVEAYRRILAEKKRNPPAIDRQFEYNTYIRAFFADNPGRTLKEAIRCWNYKKGLKGPHGYEPSDLAAL